MSMLTQPQQQQQQPSFMDPTLTRPTPNPTPTHHSDGSFGTVFIVLAVIVVISGISCCLGRLCNRKFHKPRPAKQAQVHNSRGRGRERERDMEFEPNKPGQMNHEFRPKEKERDLEFGFDKNIAASRPVGNGGPPPPPPRAFKMSDNGDIKFDPKFVKFADAKNNGRMN